MYFVSGHYRQPIVYRPDVLEDAAASVARVRDAARRLHPGASPEDMASRRDAFFDALADDFNTPRALAALAEWLREANRAEEPVGREHLHEMLSVLGLENLLEEDADVPTDALELAERRASARAARDFAEADRLREELRARGWEVRDGPAGPELVPLAP
jgi:cysteinyl-tRNA synthetase